MWSLIWSFLSSPLGTSLVEQGLGFLFRELVPDTSRRDTVLKYAGLAFQAVELASAGNPAMSGVAKYDKYIESIVDALKAAGLPDLSAAELVMLQQTAAVKAMLAKDVPPASGVIITTVKP
jgi:hypothetical protein